MSLQDIRSECSDIAGFLQPYVDGELQSDEQEKVAEHMQRCHGCRSAVSEQAWVRATLQSIDRDRAPQAVRARILQGLDAIDRESATASAAQSAAGMASPGLGARVWARLRDLGKGGLIMVPAGAVAVGLFFVARQGAGPSPSLATGPGAAPIGGALMPGADRSRRAPRGRTADPAAGVPEGSQTAPEIEHEADSEQEGDIDGELLRLVRAMQPSVGFDVQLPGNVSRLRSGAPQIQLVSASVDQEDPAADPSVRLLYELLRQGRATGHHLVDRQLRAASFDAPGRPVSVGGRQYRLHRTGAGEPVVYFELGDIVHAVMFDGHDASADVGTDMGAEIDPGGGPALPDGTAADYRPLLRVAEHLRAVSSLPPGTRGP